MEIIDGLSTGGMTLVALKRGGCYLVSHALHWLASGMYHATQHSTWLWWDHVMIRLIVAEKVYSIVSDVGLLIFLLSISSLFFDKVDSLHATLMIASISTLFEYLYTENIALVAWMVLSAVGWRAWWELYNRGAPLYLQSLAVNAYHTTLAIHDHKMSAYWVDPSSERTASVIRIALCLGAGFHFIRRQYSLPPDRLKSVLTLMTSIPLSVIGVYSSVLFFSDRETWKNNSSTLSVDIFYAFLLLDMVCAMIYYRREFSLLEGWIHHVGSLGVLMYFDKYRLYSAIDTLCIVEIPTILLGLNRVCRTPSTLYLYRKIFPWLFLLCRVILLNYMLYSWGTTSLFIIVAAIAFTILNCHWFFKMVRSRALNKVK